MRTRQQVIIEGLGCGMVVLGIGIAVILIYLNGLRSVWPKRTLEFTFLAVLTLMPIHAFFRPFFCESAGTSFARVVFLASLLIYAAITPTLKQNPLQRFQWCWFYFNFMALYIVTCFPPWSARRQKRLKRTKSQIKKDRKRFKQQRHNF